MVRLWDVRTGKEIMHFPQLPNALGAEFSPDGSRIVSCGGGEGARVWDVESGSPISLPLRHERPILAAKFSLDGRMILTGGLDGTARLWDIATGKQVGPAMQHEGRVYRVGFWPDGRTMVTSESSLGFGDSLRDARYWSVPRPLVGTDTQIELWVQTITGMELDEKGGMRLLKPDSWQARHRKLEQLGSPQDAD